MQNHNSTVCENPNPCHRQHLASDFDSTYAHAYTMKHTVGVAVWRGLAVTAKFIQRKLCRQLSAKFKFREIKALYGT